MPEIYVCIILIFMVCDKSINFNIFELVNLFSRDVKFLTNLFHFVAKESALLHSYSVSSILSVKKIVSSIKW